MRRFREDDNVSEDHFARPAQRALAAVSRRGALRRLAAGGLAAGTAAGLQNQPAVAQSTLLSAATEAAARRAVAAINRALETGDMSLLDVTFAVDYVNHTPRTSLVSGQLAAPDLAGLKASLTELRAAAPDGRIIVDDVIASGDTAAVRATFRGTLDPATITVAAGANPRVSIGGLAFARIVGGLVVESWEYDESAEVIGALTAITPEEPVTEERGERRDVRDFHAVSLQGVGTLVITQGDTESLTIEAEPRVLNRIETVVEGGTLMIRPDRSFDTDEPITYRLGAKELDTIELAGAGRVEAAQLAADQLRLLAGGAGSVSIADLTATTLDVTLAGTVQVELAGTVENQTVSVSGTGQYNAADLGSRVAGVTVDGTGKATVRASDSLDAQVSGVGSVEYIGDPSLTESVSGVGSVTKIG
jgi:hypothetical protein